MNILALDTSTQACSAALLASERIYHRYQLAPRQHTQLILPMIEALLDEARLSRREIGAVAFCHGPGSFTGLRITIGVVQGLCFGLDIPAIPISTLNVMAQKAYQELNKERTVVTLDARMQQVYWGVYELSENKIMQEVISDQLSDPTKVSLPNEQIWHGVGDGWQTYANEFKSILSLLSGFSELLPDSRYMLPLALDLMEQGSWVHAEMVKPIYLRNKVVQN